MGYGIEQRFLKIQMGNKCYEKKFNILLYLGNAN